MRDMARKGLVIINAKHVLPKSVRQRQGGDSNCLQQITQGTLKNSGLTSGDMCFLNKTLPISGEVEVPQLMQHFGRLDLSGYGCNSRLPKPVTTIQNPRPSTKSHEK